MHSATSVGAISGLPLTSLQSNVTATIVAIILWALLSAYINKNGRLIWTETLLEVHEFITAGISLILAVHVADIGHGFLVHRTGYTVEAKTLGYFYHILKWWEWLDIVLETMAGGTKISKESAFSHIFLPIWSYYRVIAQPKGNVDWRFQVIGDCLSRFLARAIPWLIEDTVTEEGLLNFVAEGRWYPDLAISLFWGLFIFQGQRESEPALNSLGQPYKEEVTARLLSIGILLYANYSRRSHDGSTSKVVDSIPIPAKSTKRTNPDKMKGRRA